MTIKIIYHANCIDGFGAALAAWKKFGNKATYIPAKYGDNPPELRTADEIYILDFSYPRESLEQMAKAVKRIQVLDHHKTAQEALRGLPYAKFDMNKSGAVMAWEYFHPNKQIPILLELIQDRDLWQFRYQMTKPVTAALHKVIDREFSVWEQYLHSSKLAELYNMGETLIIAQNKCVESLMRNAHSIELQTGVVGLAVNSAEYQSELGHELAEKSGTFGVVYYYDGAKKLWVYSLRSIDEFDVSEIAKSFGGGHKNAAGFSVPAWIGAV